MIFKQLLCVSLSTGILLPCLARAYGQEEPKALIDQQEAQAQAPLNPLVAAVRETEPTTPRQLVRAAQAMMKLGQVEEAKRYLQAVLDTQPDADVLVDLQQHFGSVVFVRMVRDKTYHPKSLQLAEMVLTAADRATRDPQRLEALVAQLRDPNPQVRAAATAELREGGSAAVAPLVQALGDESQAEFRPRVRHALASLKNAATEPLLGVLQSPDSTLRSQAVEVLGMLSSRRAAPHLVRPLLNGSPAEQQAAHRALLTISGRAWEADEAEQFLLEEARRHLEGVPPVAAEHDQVVDLWGWDPQRQQSVPRRYTTRQAAVVVAAQLAQDLNHISPDNTDHQHLLLLTYLEAAQSVAGIDQPLPGDVITWAQQRGSEQVSAVLGDAMSQGYAGAAIGAARVLGELGDVDVVHSASGQPRPLVRALRHENRRLRFAAATAIVQIGPDGPYAGSSYLADALVYFLRASHPRRALVGMPNRADSSNLVTMLAELGWDADTATTGEQLFRLATQSPDYQFVLIGEAISRPHPHALIHMLRGDRRTAELPVGMMIRSQGSTDRFERTLNDVLTDVLAQPVSLETLSRSVSRLARLSEHSRVTWEERQYQAESALGWLTMIAGDREKYRSFDVRCHEKDIKSALYIPELTAGTARLLGLIGSPLAQRALVEVASQRYVPIAHRQAAVAGFQTAVHQRGLLLTTGKILEQYDRYNQSRTADSDTQGILASLLDIIEKKDEG